MSFTDFNFYGALWGSKWKRSVKGWPFVLNLISYVLCRLILQTYVIFQLELWIKVTYGHHCTIEILVTLRHYSKVQVFPGISLCVMHFSMSLSDFPLLYEMMGGSLYISLSKGWFSIKCHLLIRIFFRFVTAGWYCVTKGRILLCALIFCRSADFLSSPLIELC